MQNPYPLKNIRRIYIHVTKLAVSYIYIFMLWTPTRQLQTFNTQTTLWQKFW